MRTTEEVLKDLLPKDCIWEADWMQGDWKLANTPAVLVKAIMKKYASEVIDEIAKLGIARLDDEGSTIEIPITRKEILAFKSKLK